MSQPISHKNFYIRRLLNIDVQFLVAFHKHVKAMCGKGATWTNDKMDVLETKLQLFGAIHDVKVEVSWDMEARRVYIDMTAKGPK